MGLKCGMSASQSCIPRNQTERGQKTIIILGMARVRPNDVASAGGHLYMAAMLRQARISKCEAFAMGQQERLGAGSQVQSFVQKGVSLGHVGRNQNLKDLTRA